VCGRSRVCESQRSAKSNSVASGSPTTSTSTQVVVLPWRYDAEMGTANSLRVWRNTASIIKGLVLEYLTRNNQGRRRKNFQEEAIEK